MLKKTALFLHDGFPYQERHGMLLRIDFEAFIKNNQPVDLRIDPKHDSNLDYIEKVNVNFASEYQRNS